MTKEQRRWDLWSADSGAMGTPFALHYHAPADTLLIYDAPETLDVQVRESDDSLIASGEDLARTTSLPVTRLRIEGKKILRAEIWPHEADYGAPILLSGQETGRLKESSEDVHHQEWHLEIEFSNHRSGA